jgi:TolA-binding protein
MSARNGVTPADSTMPPATEAAPLAPARSEASLANQRTSPVARAERPPSAPPRTPPTLVERPAAVPPTAPGASSTAWPVGGASVRPGPAAPRIDLGRNDVGDADRGDGVASANGSSAELAAYRRAHDAHFRGTDPAAALAAWDAYLASYPDSALALDARYDRALLLVKLERWREADAALRPFAAAAAGSYRQAEAARLRDAIAGRSR